MFSMAVGTAKWLFVLDTVGGLLFHAAWLSGLIDPMSWIAVVQP